MSWETLDIAALLAAREAQHESTTSANAGPYTRGFGPMMRRQIPVGAPEKCDGHECALDHAAWAELYGR